MRQDPDQEIVDVLRSVDVPEPSPLFWEHFSERVRQAVANEPPPAPGWSTRFNLAWAVGILGMLAVVVISAVLASGYFRGRSGPALEPTVADAQAATAPRLSPIEDDDSLRLIGDLTSQMDWDEAGAAGLVAAPGAADGALSQLTQDEQRAVVELLQQELKSPSGASAPNSL